MCFWDMITTLEFKHYFYIFETTFKFNPMSIHPPLYHPNEVPERFRDAWNRNDPSGIAALFVDDADFINVTGWENKKDIFEAHDFGLRIIFQDSDLEIIRTKVKMLSDDIAVVHSHIRITGQTAQKEKDADLRETIFLFVVKKTNEHWLCISAQNTDIVFGKQTNFREEDGRLHSVSYKERIPFSKLNTKNKSQI